MDEQARKEEQPNKGGCKLRWMLGDADVPPPAIASLIALRKKGSCLGKGVLGLIGLRPGEDVQSMFMELLEIGQKGNSRFTSHIQYSIRDASVQMEGEMAGLLADVKEKGHNCEDCEVLDTFETISNSVLPTYELMEDGERKRYFAFTEGKTEYV